MRHLLETWNWHLDGWIVATGIVCAMATALLGNFLVLRRLSLMGDAISHAVLPGLAAAFFLTGDRDSVIMFVGAAVVGVLTAVLTQWIRDRGNVDEGASQGVVFTVLFAIGLVLIVQVADDVDLDPSCVLHGAIEFAPLDPVPVLGWPVPRAFLIGSMMLAVNSLFVVALFKELKLTSFDASLATTLGISAQAIHYILMTLVALTSVATFESVGSILVVAMFVTPPATAMLLTDRLSRTVLLSLAIAAMSALMGHIGAIVVPAWFGFRSTSTAGGMAVACGMIFALAALFAPRYGAVSRWWLQQAWSLRVLAEDILATMYRHEERAASARMPRKELSADFQGRGWRFALALGWLRRSGHLDALKDGYRLTDKGRGVARTLVRSHRLWETYLIDQAGVAAERIHEQAEQLEHVTGRALRDRLGDFSTEHKLDPHGSPIPLEITTPIPSEVPSELTTEAAATGQPPHPKPPPANPESGTSPRRE